MKKESKVLLASGIVFAAICMRSPIGSVGPLVKFIKSDFLLSNSEAGMITTIPLILFALAAPLAGIIAPRFKSSTVVLFCLLLILGGGWIRSYTNAAGLFLGTILLGTGIGTLNVIQLAIIREQFPDQIGLMTGIYTTSMKLFAALGSGLSVSLVFVLSGWRNALSLWTSLSLIAIILWLLISRSKLLIQAKPDILPLHVLGQNFRKPKFWLISGFMGSQALIYYCIVAWLPTILATKSSVVQTIGLLMFLVEFLSVISGFATPIFTHRIHNGLPAVIISSGCYLIGILIVFLSNWIPLLIFGCCLIGTSSGASFSYALLLIGMNGSTRQETAWLSGFSQMVGYIIAAIGPVLLGSIFDATRSWTIPVLILCLASIGMFLIGKKANDQTQSTTTDRG